MPDSLLEAVPKIWWQNLGLSPPPLCLHSLFLQGARLKSEVYRLQRGKGFVEKMGADYDAEQAARIVRD